MRDQQQEYARKNNRAVDGIYWNNSALRVILEYLGAPGFPGLEPGLKRLNQSGNLWNWLLKVHPEGMVVTGKQIDRSKVSSERYNLRSPAVCSRDYGREGAFKTIYHDSLDEHPALELNMQLWQRDTRLLSHPLDTRYRGDIEHARPTRVIFVVDVEYKDKINNRTVIIDQQGVFEKVQEVVKSIESVIQRYGISYLKVMTGKGYNLVGHVPEFSPVFNDLMTIGNRLEDSLLYNMSQVVINRKGSRLHQVSKASELAHKGAMRIMQFVTNEGWRQYRRDGGKMRITTKADGKGEQVVIDQYLLAVEASQKGTGIPGCPYLRFWYQDWVEGYDALLKQVLSRTPIPIRLPLGYPGKDKISIEGAIQTRNNFYAAMEYLSYMSGVIPNCSEGLARAIKDYRKSDLAKMHRSMDEKGDKAMDIGKEASKLPREIAEMLYHPDKHLKSATGLGTFVRALYTKRWHPKDIASLLSTALLNSGGESKRVYSPHRNANGETERVLGEYILGLR